MNTTIEYVCNSNNECNVIINGESFTLEEIRDLFEEFEFPFSWQQIYVDPTGDINASNNEYDNGTTEYPMRNSIDNFFSNWRMLGIERNFPINTKEGRALAALFSLPKNRLWDFVKFLQGMKINGRWSIRKESFNEPTQNYGGRKKLKSTKKMKKTKKTRKTRKTKKTRKTRKIKKRN
jgi:hypothetical protein